MKEKLTEMECKFHRNNVNQKKYNDVPYLSKVRIKDLDNNMVNLDQLPKFQDNLQDMHEKFHQMPFGSPQDQAYLLQQYYSHPCWNLVNKLQYLLRGVFTV